MVLRPRRPVSFHDVGIVEGQKRVLARGGQKGLSRVFVLFVNVEAFDEGLPRGARADVILHGLNEPEGERLTLFVGAWTCA